MIIPAAPLEPRNGTPAPRAAAQPRPVAEALAPASGSPDSEAALREAIAAIERAATALDNSVQLSIDADSGRTVVRVIDSETGQLIRQIPSEELLSLRNALERIAGLLIDRTA
jgi:flagellar protein FlaG